MSEEKKTGRGGARPGSGPRGSGKEMTTVTFRMTVESAEKLKKLAEGAKKPRWKVLADMIDRHESSVE